MKNKHINKLYPVMIASLVPGILSAAGKQPSNPYLLWMMDNIFLVLSGLVILGVGVTLWNLSMAMIEEKSKEVLRAQGIEPTIKSTDSGTSLWQKLNDMAWRLVPMDKEADIDLGHDYDGIRELDNSLPPWWIYGFYVSIVVGIGYLYVYHFSDIGLSQQEEYELAMQRGEDQKADYAARQTTSIDENNLAVLTDADAMEVGKTIYMNNCATCHGNEGQGSVGPNMTDDYWIHGGHVKDLYMTIKNGVPEKGMIAWKSQLKPSTILKVASYIKSLKGTNPPNPKAKQGEFYEEPLAMNAEE